MSERWKKILFIVFFVLVVGGVGFALYWVFFRPLQPTDLPPGQQPTGQGQLPTAGQATGTRVPPGGTTGLPRTTSTGAVPSAITPTGERSRILSDRAAKGLSLQPTGQGVRFYDERDGKFYRLNADGTLTALSDQTFFNVDRVDWGKRTDQAILTYPDGSKLYYDFRSQRQVTLPKHWEDFDFSPTDDQVVLKSIGNNPTNRFLVVSNPDGTNAEAIESMGDNHDRVDTSWSPNDQVVAFALTAEEPLGYDRQGIVVVGKNQENFKNLIVEGRGMVPQWSPSGSQLLYSVYTSDNGFRPTLWVSGAVGDQINANRQSLGIQTWADKCAWQEETTLICAVPTSLQEGAGLQRAIADRVPDHIFRLNLSTGSVVDLGAPARLPTTISQLVVSPDGRSVYYTDLATGSVSQFDL
jgi:hypothetical protein